MKKWENQIHGVMINILVGYLKKVYILLPLVQFDVSGQDRCSDLVYSCRFCYVLGLEHRYIVFYTYQDNYYTRILLVLTSNNLLPTQFNSVPLKRQPVVSTIHCSGCEHSTYVELDYMSGFVVQMLAELTSCKSADYHIYFVTSS